MAFVTRDAIGEIVLENTTPLAEMFTHQDLGGMNVTLAWQIAREMKLPTVKLPLDEEFRQILASMGAPEEQTLARMTPQRMREPVLFLRHADAHTYLIDGTHRLHARIDAGLRWAKAVILPPETYERIRITAYRVVDGRKVPVDMGAMVKRNVRTFAETQA